MRHTDRRHQRPRYVRLVWDHGQTCLRLRRESGGDVPGVGAEFGVEALEGRGGRRVRMRVEGSRKKERAAQEGEARAARHHPHHTGKQAQHRTTTGRTERGASCKDGRGEVSGC